MILDTCFCCDLRLGVLGYGVIGLVTTTITFILYLLECTSRLGIFNLLGLTWNVVIFLLFFCLVIGVYYQQKIFLLPILILKGFLLVILSVVWLYLTFGHILVIHQVFIFYFQRLLPLVLFWYLWCCILSLYQLFVYKENRQKMLFEEQQPKYEIIYVDSNDLHDTNSYYHYHQYQPNYV